MCNALPICVVERACDRHSASEAPSSIAVVAPCMRGENGGC